MENAADDPATHRAHDENGRVSLGDQRVGNAEEKSEDDSNEPSRPGQLDAADNQTDPKSADERGQQRRRLVWKLHRQHCADDHRAEDQAAD